MEIKKETITIKRTYKKVWMKRFDDYEKSFKRISEKEAKESLETARNQGQLFFEDDDEYGALYSYYN